MALLSNKDSAYLTQAFAALTRPVRLVMFSQAHECEYCSETRQILDELAALAPAIQVETHDFAAERTLAEGYGIDKIPAFAVTVGGDDPHDYGIRYYGIPSGYEFSSLVEDILMVSRGDSGLTPATRAALAELTTPLHLQVFVTPTCPYCPRAVRLAHQLALESPLVRGDAVEAIEFPHLAHKYEVMGVPRTVVNETLHIEGAVPEQALMQTVLKAVVSESW